MESRRQQVLQVAQALFLERGFAQTSVQHIIKKANISKGTFYNYFASKNDCLIAILHYAQQEAFERRKQLVMNEPKDDERIFAKQIVIRMRVNKEQNLLPLFGFVFHSKDPELRTFAKTYHLYEIAWLSERFIDLYGENITNYAIDCAIFVLGLTQQYSLAWSYYISEEVNIEQLIMFILKKMRAVVAHFTQEKESFIHQDLTSQVEDIWKWSNVENEVIQQLKQFEVNYLLRDEVSIQYVRFITEELVRKHPRVHVVKSIMKTLVERHNHTEHASEVHRLNELILATIDD